MTQFRRLGSTELMVRHDSTLRGLPDADKAITVQAQEARALGAEVLQIVV